MEHGIVPRPRITRCPPAYCAPSQHARPLTPTERDELHKHQEALAARRRELNTNAAGAVLNRWHT